MSSGPLFVPVTVIKAACPACGSTRTLCQYTTATLVARKCLEARCQHEWKYAKDLDPNRKR